MNIKADETLFNETYKIACKVTKLAEIIQNDQELSPEAYAQWAQDGLATTEMIKEWMVKVAVHARSSNV